MSSPHQHQLSLKLGLKRRSALRRLGALSRLFHRQRLEPLHCCSPPLCQFALLDEPLLRSHSARPGRGCFYRLLFSSRDFHFTAQGLLQRGTLLGLASQQFGFKGPLGAVIGVLLAAVVVAVVIVVAAAASV